MYHIIRLQRKVSRCVMSNILLVSWSPEDLTLHVVRTLLIQLWVEMIGLPRGTNVFGMVMGYINTFRPRQNWRHFADDIFRWIVWITLMISLKFVPKVRIKNISAFVQIMVWPWLGDKPLSEPMLVSLLTPISNSTFSTLNGRATNTHNSHLQYSEVIMRFESIGNAEEILTPHSHWGLWSIPEPH